MEHTPRDLAEPNFQEPEQSLATPPQRAKPSEVRRAASVLILIKDPEGGDHIIVADDKWEWSNREAPLLSPLCNVSWSTCRLRIITDPSSTPVIPKILAFRANQRFHAIVAKRMSQ
ncbi:hypothetical protein V6N11_065248 [Hibiscus sabdariffa]|uniref:Uncharacterized protein n=1 Tax=Hibiscus sabdariffa TaxID=183260 RepID=A0ABR2QGZ5_9ROSI